MGSTPMSYESIEVLLKNMSANKRFEAALHIPSIQEMEKNVPLHINKLEFRRRETFIDDVSYSLCLYVNGEKTGFDVDDRGVLLYSEKHPLEHGDVEFDLDETDESEDEDEEEEDGQDSEIEAPEEILVEPNNDEDGVEIEENTNNEDPHEELGDSNDVGDKGEYEENSDNETSDDELDDSHKDGSGSDEKANVVPPPNCFIQLEIRSKKETITKQFNYSTKLHVAMRLLNSRLFGGRNGKIHIKEFHASYFGPFRLPSDFKIIASEIHGQRFMISTIERILHESSFPLAVVSTSGKRNLEDPTAKIATKLVVNMPIEESEWLSTMFKLTNKHVCVEGFNHKVGIEQYITFIDTWLERHPAVGTLFDFHLSSIVQKLFEKCLEHYDVSKKGARSMTIPLENGTVLRINYVKKESPYCGRQCARRSIHNPNKTDYIMTFEICQNN